MEVVPRARVKVSAPCESGMKAPAALVGWRAAGEGMASVNGYRPMGGASDHSQPSESPGGGSPSQVLEINGGQGRN